jgi:RNA polymerase sigma factor (sigma-70 family)
MKNAESTVTQEAVLVARASDGDRDAMAELYDRYFDRIYDFVHRMMRDADETADLVQDVFMKAMSSMGSLRKGERFRSWLFSIAHNMTLNRIEKQKRIVRPRSDEEDEEPRIYQQIDPDRMADPEAALVDGETAALVWEAAAGLDRKQYALLDLHVRQGLDSAEIAEVLGVSKGNAYTMVSRMKSSVAESITAFLMVRRGSEDCPALNELIIGARAGGMTPELRRLVTGHISECEVCSENKKRIASPLAVLGAFAAVPPPLGLKEGIFQNISGSLGGPPQGNGSGGSRAGRNTLLAAVGAAGIGGAAIISLLVLFGAFSGNGDSAALGAVGAPSATATTGAGLLSGEATVTPTPPPTPTPPSPPPAPEPTSTPPPAPTATPIRNPTPTPVPDTAGPEITNPGANQADIWEDWASYPLLCEPKPGEAIIAATITDPAGVNQVSMSWSVASVNGSVWMIQSGSTWSATVGPFDEATVVVKDGAEIVKIMVAAVDNFGNSSEWETKLTLHDCPRTGIQAQ